jgi:23S rRNA (cytidine1920-2'-O)/16S rRNA (cytidine1409-2'-O)-methyltransferase
MTSRPTKQRADVLLCERGLAPSRSRAQSFIMAGEAFANDVRIDKPGTLLSVDVVLRVTPRRRFVSRGGEKLEGALAAFGARFADLSGVVAVDVGASTGGFTDCLLQRGAAKVYAIDVGYGQLDDKLRADTRVVSRERTNARDLTAADFQEAIDLVVVDASFIGLAKLLPAIRRILAPSGELVALVKPQFEAGRAEVSRGRGVIRDDAVREEAIGSARRAALEEGFDILAEVDSAVPGPKGNRERFLNARARQE